MFFSFIFLTAVSAQFTDLSAWPALDVAPAPNPKFTAPVLAKLQAVSEAIIISDCPLPNQWAITYDDGPSIATTTLLDSLKARNLKASFCVVGSRITENPEILKRTYNEGHQIILHSWSHVDYAKFSDEVVITDIQWNIEAVKAVIGVVPRYFRMPFGSYNNNTLRILAAMNLIPVLWNHDTEDYKFVETKQSPEKIFSDVASWIAETNPVGIVSLEHDLYPEAVGWATQILDTISKSKYSMMPMGTCLNDNQWYAGVFNSTTNMTMTLASGVVPTLSGANTSATVQTGSSIPRSKPAGVEASSALGVDQMSILVFVGSVVFKTML